MQLPVDTGGVNSAEPRTFDSALGIEANVKKSGSAPNALPLLFDIETVAGSLAISIRQVRRLVAEDRIPYLRIGGLIRFDPDEIIEWVDDRRFPKAALPPGRGEAGHKGQ
jgi:excisionase family DNA binding protein